MIHLAFSNDFSNRDALVRAVAEDSTALAYLSTESDTPPIDRPVARATLPFMGKLSWRSEDSFLSIASRGSILSIGSAGSVLSIGSVGSALSIASVGSTLSAFSAGSVLSVGSALSARSRWSLLSSDGDHDVLKAQTRFAFVGAGGAGLVVLLAGFSRARSKSRPR
ncbi:hypothetical protein [Kribbella pittospori]|uniref:hypothetical protein n=1 Tax=Kribbella pittospori TaxID=722689 RepID=UPI00192D3603|nr:hypothetical protein [Kribbella pittospori]